MNLFNHSGPIMPVCVRYGIHPVHWCADEPTVCRGCGLGDDVDVNLDNWEQLMAASKSACLGTPVKKLDLPDDNFVQHMEEGLESRNVAKKTATEMKDSMRQYGHPKFYQILEAMADLHSRKNHDYAGTSDPLKNLRACTRIDIDPFIGVIVRLQDKWSRIEEFVKAGTLLVKGESVKDTLMDNAVYSLLAIILLEEQEDAER